MANSISETWKQWDGIHNDPAQHKRLKSAASASCTPRSTDQIEGAGVFQGRHGTYSTSLSSCTCVDFVRRKLPCKHMYRLALEFSLIEGDYKSDSNQVRIPIKEGLSLKEAIANIENLPEDSQILLCGIFAGITANSVYVTETFSPALDSLLTASIIRKISIHQPDINEIINCYTGKEIAERLTRAGIVFDTRLKVRDLKEWCVNNISEKFSELFNDHNYTTVTVTVSPKYEPQRFKIYRYLDRKYGTTEITDDYIHFFTIPCLETELPEDDITALLREYGYYKK